MPPSLYSIMKAATDRLVAFTLLLLLSPMLALACVAIVMESKGPILFRQTRVGRGQKTFSILKLRTMTLDSRREISQTFNNSAGVTRTGAFLRRWKLDELPQLINVLRGDMSLVGPRPCLPDLPAEMDAVAKRRFEVRPGLTGLAQINGNVNLPWPVRWQYDVQYVDNRGLMLDLQILLTTVSVIFKGESQSGGTENP